MVIVLRDTYFSFPYYSDSFLAEHMAIQSKPYFPGFLSTKQPVWWPFCSVVCRHNWQELADQASEGQKGSSSSPFHCESCDRSNI